MMGIMRRTIAVLFVAWSAGVSAAEQSELDALRQRLADVEALLADLQARLDPATDKPSSEQGMVLSERTIPSRERPDELTAAAETLTLFPQLANQSRFTMQSRDGDFSLSIDGLLVGRAEYNYRSDDGTGSTEHDSGFQTTATRVNFRGKVYGDYGYWARLQADEFGSTPIFDTLAGIYEFNDNTLMAVGQFANVMTREQGLMVEKIQAVEATATNNVFDPFAFKGVILGHHTPRFVFRGILNDGYRSFANGYDEVDQGPSADWAFAGQVLTMAVGDKDDWERFNNITSRPGSDFAWQINTSFHTQANPDIFLGILESSLEGDGWNIYTSGYYRDSDEEFDGVGGDDLGFVFQSGMWTSKHTELYTRYDITRPDSDRPDEGDSFRTITAGLNFYPRPYTDSVKFQGEMLYMLDPESDSLVQPGALTSVRASPDGGQFVFRLQGQLRW